MFPTLLCFLSQEAINLLEPMTNDPVNYVRQGALIASALIMIQQTEVTCPKVSEQAYQHSVRLSALFSITIKQRNFLLGFKMYTSRKTKLLCYCTSVLADS